MAGDVLLSVEGLSLALPARGSAVHVVDGLSFQLHRGETLGLLGESGCGKSLTALAILKLLPPAIQIAAGSVQFDGVDLLALSERKLRPYRGGRIAMVFQEPMTALNPVLTAGFQIEEVLEVHSNLGKRERRAAVHELLGETGLPEPEKVAAKYPHELSGGMRQRVMLAMALAGQPEVLLADEPTTALDVTVQAQILDLIRDLQEKRGMSVLWVSHDLGVVAELCHRVAVMYAGRLAECGPVGTLFDAPAHPYTKGLMAARPRLDRKEAPVGVPGRVPQPSEFPTGCRFRDRCSDAGDDCAAEPSWTALAAGHGASCWRVAAPAEEAAS